MLTWCRDCEAVTELEYPCQCFAEKWHKCIECGSVWYDTIGDNDGSGEARI